MPVRSPQAARERFLAPLRRSLSCVTSALVYAPAGKRPGDVEALALSEDPLWLRSASVGRIQFLLGHEFKVVQEGRKDFRVTTTGYRYHLLDEDDRELIAWHWHPDAGAGYPHIHVPAGLVTRKAHIPTGRVSIESVLRFLIDDLRVRPARDDYADVLKESEGPFIRYRRWHA